MPKVLKSLLAIGMVLLPLVSFALQFAPTQVDRGAEWLSWNATERTRYIDGFLTGYFQGRNRACEAADDLFEVGKPHSLTNQPMTRCLARIDSYSKFRYEAGKGLQVGAYTTVITDFYTKHPEYRTIPFFYLMLQLTDNQYKTADQLYRMALEGNLRTNFSFEK